SKPAKTARKQLVTQKYAPPPFNLAPTPSCARQWADTKTQKAEAAASKAAVENSKKAASEDAEWSKGAKSNAKKDDAEAKKAEAARKKAEKDALLAAEEKDLASARSAPKNSKTAIKKTTKGLDLSQLDEPSTTTPPKTNPALNATGIDNALDALSLTSNNPSEKVDRHPERRFKAAYAAFEARRLPEIEEEYKGLRKNQRVEMCRKEFEKSAENPFNQVSARFDSTREEIREMKEKEREKVEARLVGS
ncbi:MAG: hypothetical protein Q9164_003776, partial [Protoblastenia rupestris]